MPTSAQPSESSSHTPARRQARGAQRAKPPTVEQVEAALAEAPHRHIVLRPRHAEKFVSRANGRGPRPTGDPVQKTQFTWKDAAEFGKAQEIRRNSTYHVRRRNEKLRFWLMVTGGSALAVGSVLMAFFK